LDSGSVRSQNDSDAKERLVKGAVWMRPGVKEALESLADQTGLSFSATAAKGLEVYVRAKIQDQQDTLFQPRMQAMMRREIRASDNRHLYFEMRNAIAAEQTRILITDLYKRQLRKEGMPLKEINTKLDNTYNMARGNVLRKTKTPQLKNLLDAWWRSTEDLPDRQTGQADGSQEQNAGRGEAGTEKP
jgi:DNA helicase IV